MMLEWLMREVRVARTADIQRAALFLEWARDVRSGCAKQRGKARAAQMGGWRKKVDEDIRW
jgi:hypothetical protein